MGLWAGVVLCLLASDLLLKTWAFDHVAAKPIQLSFGDDGITQVAVRDPATGDRVIRSPRVPGEPASAIPYHEGIDLIPGVLSLKLTLNTGAVFGLGSGGQTVYAVIAGIAVLVCGRVILKSPAKAYGTQLAMAMVIAGALGNLHDRLRFHAVRDMLYLMPDVHLPLDLAWPGGATELYPWIFNLADVYLIVGVGLVIIHVMRSGPRERSGESTAD